jgi:hypothetical protein
MPQKWHVTIHAKHCAPEFTGHSVDLADGRCPADSTNLAKDAGSIRPTPLVVISGRRSPDGIAESHVSRLLPGETTANSLLTAF